MKAGLVGVMAVVVLAACVSTGRNGTESETEAAKYNLQLGIAYLRQGNLAVAKTKLERARSENPRDASTHSALALLYERLGKDKESDAEHRAAERIAPDDPDVINNYAVYLCRKGRTDEGVKRFERAAANKLYTTPWAAYTNAGVCLRAAGRNPAAALEFEHALQVRPDYAEAAFQAADLQFAEHQYAAAQQRITAFLAGHEATADLLLLGWRVAEANHDPAAAIRFGLRLKQEFPKSAEARALPASTTSAGATRVNPG